MYSAKVVDSPVATNTSATSATFKKRLTGVQIGENGCPLTTVTAQRKSKRFKTNHNDRNTDSENSDAEERIVGLFNIAGAKERDRITTMAELCSIKSVKGGKETKAAQELRKKKENEKERRKQARLHMKIAKQQGKSVEEIEWEDGIRQSEEQKFKDNGVSLNSASIAEEREEEEVMQLDDEDVAEENSDGDDVNTNAPKIRYVNGQAVIDQSVLVLRTTEIEEEQPKREVVEEQATRYINQATFQKRKALNNSRWSSDETAMFYEALSYWGTDFDLIAQMFPNRNRVQLKNKFNREEKINPDKITKALQTKRSINIERYAELTGIPTENFNRPPPEIPAPNLAVNDDNKGFNLNKVDPYVEKGSENEEMMILDEEDENKELTLDSEDEGNIGSADENSETWKKDVVDDADSDEVMQLDDEENERYGITAEIKDVEGIGNDEQSRLDEEDTR